MFAFATVPAASELAFILGGAYCRIRSLRGGTSRWPLIELVWPTQQQYKLYRHREYIVTHNMSEDHRKEGKLQPIRRKWSHSSSLSGRILC
jgi:hypothetical protein